nr:MAG TPA: hypothetical protein [Caudoviricetes sp.]
MDCQQNNCMECWSTFSLYTLNISTDRINL